LPFWAGIHYVVFVPYSAAAAMVIMVANLRRWRVAAGDLLVFGFFAVAVTLTLVGDSNAPQTVRSAIQWIPAYMLGRVVAPRLGLGWVGRALAIGLTCVGALAVFEYVAGWHPYEHLFAHGDQWRQWGGLQVRGGRVRSEWAFGHAIALGGALVIGFPLAFAYLRRQWVAVSVLGLAVLCTLSRGPLLSAGLALVLSVYVFRRQQTRRRRRALGVALVILVVVAIRVSSQVSSDASGELESSARYRSDLYSTVVGDLRPFGVAANTYERNGALVHRDFISIDNAALRIGLAYGYIPLAGLIVGFAVIVCRVGRRRAASPWDVAVVALVPCFATVAFITQYADLVWLCIGVATAAHQASLTGRGAPRLFASLSGASGTAARRGDI
jgi:hypothetical protein